MLLIIEFLKINFLTVNKAHTRPLEKITELLNFRSLRTTKKNFIKQRYSMWIDRRCYKINAWFLPKSVYRLSTIHIKHFYTLLSSFPLTYPFPLSLFLSFFLLAKVNKLILHFIRKCKRWSIIKAFLKKKNKVGRREKKSLLKKKNKMERFACMCSVAQSCPTLCGTMHYSQLGLASCPWSFPGPGVGCHFLLQGIFPTQGLNLHLFYLPALAGGLFTTSTTWESPKICLLYRKESLGHRKGWISVFYLFTLLIFESLVLKLQFKILI